MYFLSFLFVVFGLLQHPWKEHGWLEEGMRHWLGIGKANTIRVINNRLSDEQSGTLLSNDGIDNDVDGTLSSLDDWSTYEAAKQ